MNTKELIETAVKYSGTTKSKIAKELGWSPQHFHRRVQYDKFTHDEWNEIAKAMGAYKAETHIYFPDGKVI